MIDWDRSDPPRYKFGLLGHRTSGKTVYLVALGATRREEVDGVSAKFLHALPPERGKIINGQKSAEDLKLAYAESLEALQGRRLPAQTNTNDGNLRYAFELGRPITADSTFTGSSVRLVEISDHAGELINRLTKETKKAAMLRNFLANQDGIILVAEVPRSDADEQERTNALAEITSLSSLLSEVVMDLGMESLRCRSVVLLVSKWDRVHPFDGVQRADESHADFMARMSQEEARHQQLFEQWLDTSDAAEHRRLLNDLIGRFGKEAVKAYPVSAFGEALAETEEHEGVCYKVELPSVIPLPALNLVKPLTFLCERTDSVFKAALYQNLDRFSPGRWFHVWRLTDLFQRKSNKLPRYQELQPRFGHDLTLKSRIDTARGQFSRAHKRQALALSIGLVSTLSAASVYEASVTAQNLRNTANLAISDPALERIIEIDQRLADWPESSRLTLQGWLHRLFLTVDESTNLREQLQQIECAQWERVIDQAITDGNQSVLDEFDNRFSQSPRCNDNSQTISSYRVSQNNQRTLDDIDARLNEQEFVRAIELIFSAARDTNFSSSSIGELRARLDSVDERLIAWTNTVQARQGGPERVLSTWQSVRLALLNPPEDLNEQAQTLREHVEKELEPQELQVACADYATLLREVRTLSDRIDGWPLLDAVDNLSERISAWSIGSRSEFANATVELRRHVESFRRIRIQSVATSGTLTDALGVSDASFKLKVGSEELDDVLDTSRKELNGRFNRNLSFNLSDRVILEADLIEERWVRTRNWEGAFGEGLTWNALRENQWTAKLELLNANDPTEKGELTVSFQLEVPDQISALANAPQSCNR